MLREHATHWVIGGLLLALTGLAPEEWLARAVDGLHVPANVLHLWTAGIDVRVLPIAVGIAVIAIALFRRNAVRPAPSGNSLLAGAVTQAERAGAADRGTAAPVEQVASAARPDVAPLPEMPSLAVLPFQNMSGDPEQEYFADGMAEELITGLSRVRWLYVIARNSSFAYKGKSPDIRQVGRELGARYVLEGSVRHGGNRLRITGQLIDATTGAHIWADRFDGDSAEIFDLQDRVTNSVVAAIEPKVRAAEIERAHRKPTVSLQAYDLFLRALPGLHSLDRAGIERAIALLERAIALDPGYARALALYARLQRLRSIVGGVDPSDPAVTGSVGHALLAVAKGRDDPEVLWMAAIVISFVGGDLPAGIALVDRSLALSPHSCDALAASGLIRSYMADHDTSIAHCERARQLNPTGEYLYNIYRARCVLAFGDADYESCCQWAERSLREMSDYTPTLRFHAASLGLLGRLQEARAVTARLLALCPEDTIARVRKYHVCYDRTPERSKILDALVEGLRLAGLPE
jgi:adenylate cyclase